jgi:tRNA(adenine34) deaminase
MTDTDYDYSAAHHGFMEYALREAEKALEIGEVPVGCVVVKGSGIIGKGYNQREQLQDATAHAEMIAITAACDTLGTWRLEECDLYVTLEPCPMCAGAIVLSRIRTLIYGAADPKAGACGTLYDIPRDARLNHTVEIVPGVRRDECGRMLKEFFSSLRNHDDE